MSSPRRKNFLVKSEPSEYSIQQLQQDHQQEWDGVRNYTARNHLNTMKPGDKCFFYHSSCKLPSIVGTCRIARAAQPDQTAVNPKHKNFDPKSTESNRWVSVLVEFEALFETPVTIKELRMQATINPVIANMSLLRQSRLSVMPISDEEWQAVLDLQTRKEQGEDLEQLQQQIQNKEKQRTTKRTEKVATTTSASVTSIKKQKQNPVSSDVNEPGYCSKPDCALSTAQVDTILQDTAMKVTENELGLPGRRHLYKIEDSSKNVSLLVHYFEGNKFIGKDMARMNLMVDAAKTKGINNQDDSNAYLLLSERSGICKRNTLPKILENGVIVQRVE